MTNEETRKFYPAMVTGINQDYIHAYVQVGKSELHLSFPRQVLAFHGIMHVGDRFRYFSNERQDSGVFNIRDFELVERRDSPVILPSNWLKSITSGESDNLQD